MSDKLQIQPAVLLTTGAICGQEF